MPTKNDILVFLKTLKTQLSNDGIEKIGLFGSFAKDNSQITSDIDIAVKFKENFLKTHDVWEYFNINEKIKSLVLNRFNRKVDIFDIQSVSSFKDEIEKEIIYV